MRRIGSVFARFLRGPPSSLRPAAEADPDDNSVQIEVGPWSARITPVGAWVNVAIERRPDELLDRVVPSFDRFAAFHLRACLAGGMDPAFVADGPLVLALGILREPASDTVAAVRRLLEGALRLAARHPDPRVGRHLR